MTAFIIDDSVYSRNRSKAVELLANVFDHPTHRYLKDFQLLTLGWTDSSTFIPLLGAIHVKLGNGIPVKIVFVRNRNKLSEWLAILSTDTTLDNEEIIRIYGMRWDIEMFFKCNKSLLNLGKEFQYRSDDAMISHTTIVFTRYILIT